MGQMESKLPANSSRAVKYLQRTNSHASNLEEITLLYERLKRDKKKMTRDTFSKYFNYDDKTRDHIFEVYDKNDDGVLDRDEFVRGITMCSVGNLNEKMKFCFKLSDQSGDGFLQKEEFEEVLTTTTCNSFALLTAVSQQLSEAVDGAQPQKLHPYERLVGKAAFREEIKWMVTEAYKKSDTNNDNRLSYEEFFNWVSNNREVSNFLFTLFQVHEQGKKAKTSKMNNAELLWDISDDDGADSRSSPVQRGSRRISPEPLDLDGTGALPGQANLTPKSKSKRKSGLARSPTMMTISKMNKGAVKKRKKIRNEELVSKQLSHREKVQAAWGKWTHITCAISMLGILLMVVEREILHYIYNEQENPISTFLTFVLSGNCLLLSISLVVYWIKYVEVLKDQGELSPNSTLWNTNWALRSLFVQIVVSLIHVPPYVGGLLAHDLVLRYWLTSILSWGMLLRCYLYPVLIQQDFMRAYLSSKLEFIARLAGVSLDLIFTIRAYLRIKPYRLILMFMTAWAILATFLLEEAENGLECAPPESTDDSGTNASTAGATDIRGDLDLYQGQCHLHQLPFLGWLYYTLNMLLVVNPLRMPLSVAGDIVNIFSGIGSTLIFTILIGAIAKSISPTTAEMRVIRHISDGIDQRELKLEAVRYIQNFWRLGIKMKKRAMKRMTPEQKQRFEQSTDLKERMAISESALATSGCLGRRSASQIRFKIELALMKWRLAKRRGRSLPTLACVGKDTSDLLEDLDGLKDQFSDLASKIDTVDKEIQNKMEEVKFKVQQVVSRLNK